MLSALFVIAPSTITRAEPVVFDLKRPGPRYEASAGADIAPRSHSLYGAATAALGGDLATDGFRFRSGAGQGIYRYDGKRWNGTQQVDVTFNGEQAFADAMLGYQVSIGPWIVKAFAGATYQRHTISPLDPENVVQGARIGAKAAVETWMRLGDWGFAQADANWSEAFAAWAARTRLGYRVTPQVSIGLEGGAFGNAVYDAARAGAFLRYEWWRGEVSLSLGSSSDRSGDAAPYGTLGFLLRY